MKIRVISNGHKFRVARWHWFWPFWTEYAGGDYGESPYEWSTQAEAQAWADKVLKNRAYEALPWKVVALKEEKCCSCGRLTSH